MSCRSAPKYAVRVSPGRNLSPGQLVTELQETGLEAEPSHVLPDDFLVVNGLQHLIRQGFLGRGDCQVPLCLPACLSSRLSVIPSVCLSVCSSAFLSVCLCLSVCLHFCLSVCLSVRLSAFLPTSCLPAAPPGSQLQQAYRVVLPLQLCLMFSHRGVTLSAQFSVLALADPMHIHT